MRVYFIFLLIKIMASFLVSRFVFLCGIFVFVVVVLSSVVSVGCLLCV